MKFSTSRLAPQVTGRGNLGKESVGLSLEVVKSLELPVGSKYEMGWKLGVLEFWRVFKGGPVFGTMTNAPFQILDP